MLRKFIFFVAALFLAAGALSTTTSTGYAGPGLTAGALSAVPSVVVPDSNLLQVKQCGPWNGWCGGGGGQCGPWNNWCNGGGNCGPWNNWCNGGGGGACINFGGIQLCSGGSGPNCKWYNGKKYCGPWGGGGGGGGDCTWWHGQKYCNWKKGGDCIWRHGDRYCTGW